MLTTNKLKPNTNIKIQLTESTEPRYVTVLKVGPQGVQLSNPRTKRTTFVQAKTWDEQYAHRSSLVISDQEPSRAVSPNRMEKLETALEEALRLIKQLQERKQNHGQS